jgi:hypothetical protein
LAATIGEAVCKASSNAAFEAMGVITGLAYGVPVREPHPFFHRRLMLMINVS